MATEARKPILISGAGICSLLLAQRLRRASIPFLIFERDSSFTFRGQGYRLRLSAEGLDAIEAALGPEGFPKFWATTSKTGGAGFEAMDAITGVTATEAAKQNSVTVGEQTAKNPIGSLASREGKTVGISRGDMRTLFADGCEPYIHWSHNVTSYELTPTGVRAIFANGSKSVEGEMLVGGEGIHSKIAKQVSHGAIKTYETGARGIHGAAPTTAYKQLGEGVWRFADDTDPNGRVSVITNVRPGDFDDPNINFGWTMVAQPGVIRAPNDDYTTIGKPAADIAKSLTANWHPRIKPLFDEIIEAEAAFWKITCSTPTGVPDWPNEPRVTVIGDAAHSMTPAGGIGASTAVRDSELLGRLLAEAGGYKEGITAAYEKEMRVYASEAVKISYNAAADSFRIHIDENSPTV